MILLAVAGLLTGAGSTWIFRRMANTEAVGAAWRQMQARLLEVWLYVDEPLLIWRSWGALLAANARFVWHMLLPAVILSVPMVPLFFLLDAWYGYAPLPLQTPAVVTMHLEDVAAPVTLTAPTGVSVEGPPVRVFGANEVSWRIRPQTLNSGDLVFTIGETKVAKSVSANARTRLSLRRTRPGLDSVRYPTEAPLPSGTVEWIEVQYPPANLSIAGKEVHWSVLFLAFCLLGAVIESRVTIEFPPLRRLTSVR